MISGTAIKKAAKKCKLTLITGKYYDYETEIKCCGLNALYFDKMRNFTHNVAALAYELHLEEEYVDGFMDGWDQVSINAFAMKADLYRKGYYHGRKAVSVCGLEK